MFNLWYINSAFRLLVAFALAIPWMVSLSFAGEPGGDAESARLAIQESDEYAWKLFLWINRQGQPGIAGQADPSKASVLEYDEDKDVVWETWALASRDGQPEAEVFLANGAQPGTWAELPRGKPVSKALDRNRTNAHRLLSRNPMFSRGELAPQFVIQEPESDEVRMNQSTFEFVRDNTLYNRQGLAANFVAATAAKNRDAIQFPSSAKEVKARWDKIDASQKSRYHWRTIGSDVYGLRAFHIITKDLPMWFWTDFIHVDLEAAEPDPCHDATTRGSSATHGHDGIRNETVGSKWQNYRLKGSQVTFTDSRGVPTILGNQLIEFGNAKVSSCITCHAGAGVASDGSPNFFPFIVGSPPTTIFGSGDTIAILQMDFLYSIVTRAQSLPTVAPIAGKVASAGEMRRIVEGFPAHVAAKLAMRKQSHASAIASSNGALTPQFVLHTLKRWDIGSNVNVAFRGGTTDLHRKIADATKDWTDVGNIKLDFGFNAQTGRYRTWSPTDTSYKAAIRISFDKTGYWSNVARDSIDPAIAGPSEASMNFEDFAVVLPGDWRAIVLHEFGHALGFEHEHQSPTGNCDQEFRFEDDQNYVKTKDQFGQFIQDAAGRKPGLYTVLGGPPNKWSSDVVNFNLRQLPISSAFEPSAFDKDSIMKYFFEDWMFKNGNQRSCFSGAENTKLSSLDIEGIKKLYPFSPAAITILDKQRADALQKLRNLQVFPESQLERLK